MNKIEANLSYLASPTAPIGLEILGSKAELESQEQAILIEKAQEIAFYRRFANGIRKFADYTGQLGKKISPKNLVLLGGIGVSAVAIACGGGSDANASANGAKETQPPAAGVSLTSELTATPKVEVKTPEPTKVATVVPTEAVKTATPEAKKETAWMNLLDVYMGETDKGGRLVVARIPYKPDPSGDYVIFLGYNPGDQPHLEQAKKVSFKEQSFEGIPFTGKLEGPDVITGNVVFLNQSSAPVSYRVKKIGSGKEALVSAYLSIPNRLPQNTKEVALQRINLMCRDCLE